MGYRGPEQKPELGQEISRLEMLSGGLVAGQ
jgi:hypothetical protein